MKKFIEITSNHNLYNLKDIYKEIDKEYDLYFISINKKLNEIRNLYSKRIKKYNYKEINLMSKIQR